MKTRTNNSNVSLLSRTNKLFSIGLALAATGLTSVNTLADDQSSFTSRPVAVKITADTPVETTPGGEEPGQQIMFIADADHSGHVDALDLYAFLEAWMLGRPNADIDGNGKIDTADVYLYLSIWQAAFGRPTIARAK